MKPTHRHRKPHKTRLDVRLVELKLVRSRQRAQALIMAGKVLVDGVPVTKPGTPVAPGAQIRLKGADMPFVSRGGLKLAAALQSFEVDVRGRLCLDVGASTGGFTDCLLQQGARRVYALDVGYGQLAWKLRQDPRVVIRERCNIRKATSADIPEAVDVVVIDVSFISLAIVVPAALRFTRPDADLIALIKPQFEAGRDKVGKGGIVRDEAVHREVLDRLQRSFESMGLRVQGVIPSPVRGAKGNREFLMHAVRQAPETPGTNRCCAAREAPGERGNRTFWS